MLQLRQRRRACALRPGRRGDARPHHPHQELSADRAAAASRAARRVRGGGARRGRRASSPSTMPISPATTRASAVKKRKLDPMPRVVLVPGVGLFGLGRSAQGCARSPPTSPKPRSRPCTDAEAIGRFESLPRGRSVRDGILVARAGEARHGGGKAARRPGRGRSPAAPARSASATARRCASRRRGRAARRRRRGAASGAKPLGGAASGSPAT